MQLDLHIISNDLCSFDGLVPRQTEFTALESGGGVPTSDNGAFHTRTFANQLHFQADFLLKLISGYFSASKKLADLRSSSRIFTLVSTLAVLMVTSTEDFSGLASSNCSVPANSSNLPVTFENKCRI